jgi:hypothetical protein
MTFGFIKTAYQTGLTKLCTGGDAHAEEKANILYYYSTRCVNGIHGILVALGFMQPPYPYGHCAYRVLD